ncbi:MAG: hypothetical protein ACPIA6_07955, partial [Poseidonia sp.]
MSKKGKDPTAQRFGGEFGPYRKEGTQGVTLSTFKTLVWTSNIGGLLLVVLALELLFVQQRFNWGFLALVLGVAVALFPSNYEIVGMNEDDDNDYADGGGDDDYGEDCGYDCYADGGGGGDDDDDDDDDD